MQKKLYDLTNPQKSIWYTGEFFKNTPIENILGTVILSEKVNFELLEKAINIFVEKNDSFRLKFIIENQNVKQYVEPYSYFNIDLLEISSDEDLRTIEKDFTSNVFNVLNSFLYNFKLIKFSDGHGGFIISIHHLISDAWSSGFGSSEIIKIYTNLLKNENIEEISYPSYIDYITTEQDYINSDRYKKDKAFWEDMFENIPEITTIPKTTQNKENALDCTSNRKEFTIPKEIIDNISNFCKDKKVSIFNFFMAIYSIYISRVSGQEEFCLGTPVLNRSNIKDKHTSGMFVSTVPLKVSLKNNIPFKELTSNISSSMFNIFKHQKYSYLSVLEDLRAKNNSNIPGLYKILISYQNIRSSAQNKEMPFNIKWIPNGCTSDDIDIHIYDMNDTGNISIAYDFQISKYVENDINNIHNRILNLINQVIENNTININELDIVTPEEKNTLLVEFNNNTLPYDASKSIKDIFENQAVLSSNKIVFVS
mgnify:CR=1 FL=1